MTNIIYKKLISLYFLQNQFSKCCGVAVLGVWQENFTRRLGKIFSQVRA